MKKDTLFIIAFVAMMIAGHAYVVAHGINGWPFSNYPMFSDQKLDQYISVLRIRLVLDDGTSVRVPLNKSLFGRIRCHFGFTDYWFDALHKFLREEVAHNFNYFNPDRNRIRIQKFLTPDLLQTFSSAAKGKKIKSVMLQQMHAQKNERGAYDEVVAKQALIPLDGDSETAAIVF